MTRLQLEIEIHAPIERVFDLARSIDAHQSSTAGSKEQAVGGRTEGLIECGETVEWEATHLGVRQRLKVEIVEMERPTHFEDRMISGAFKSMRHRHEFSEFGGVTTMRDTFDFAAPFGLLGVLVERIFLARYMQRFLEERNAELKRMAEGDDWQAFL